MVATPPKRTSRAGVQKGQIATENGTPNANAPHMPVARFALNDAAGNRFLSALAQGLYDIALDVRRVASGFPGVIEKSVNQHIDVARAVAAGDQLGAVAAGRRHLEHVRDTTITAMANGTTNQKEA